MGSNKIYVCFQLLVRKKEIARRAGTTRLSFFTWTIQRRPLRLLARPANVSTFSINAWLIHSTAASNRFQQQARVPHWQRQMQQQHHRSSKFSPCHPRPQSSPSSSSSSYNNKQPSMAASRMSAKFPLENSKLA